VWISTAQVAEKMLILARTTPLEEVTKHSDGLSLFYTKFDRDFIRVHEIEKMGRKAVDSNELFIDGLKVPVEDRIGEEGKGFHYIMHGMNAERILIAAEGVGLGRVALKKATAYAKERVVFDRPIGMNQGIQHPLATNWMELEAANLMVFQAACGESFGTAQFHRYNIQGLSSSLGTMTGEAVEIYSAHYDLSLQETIEVQVLHLGLILQLIGIETIHFLLLDCQGMDFTILKTVEPWISESRVALIQLEADGDGFRHYDGLPDNSEASIIEWMRQFPQYELSYIEGRMVQQPDLIFALTEPK
jgi:FkbM family methyltransferase